MSEADERFPAGPRGVQGKQGERGERGLSWRVRWSIVVLFVINFLGTGGNLLWTAHEVSSAATAQKSSQQQQAGAEQRQQASQRQQAAAEQAAQQRAGAAIEAKLCSSLLPLAGLAGLKPPAGNPADNPSRAYEQEQAAKLAPLAQLGPDLGCKP